MRERDPEVTVLALENVVLSLEVSDHFVAHRTVLSCLVVVAAPATLTHVLIPDIQRTVARCCSAACDADDSLAAIDSCNNQPCRATMQAHVTSFYLLAQPCKVKLARRVLELLVNLMQPL